MLQITRIKKIHFKDLEAPRFTAQQVQTRNNLRQKSIQLANELHTRSVATCGCSKCKALRTK